MNSKHTVQSLQRILSNNRGVITIPTLTELFAEHLGDGVKLSSALIRDVISSNPHIFKIRVTHDTFGVQLHDDDTTIQAHANSRLHRGQKEQWRKLYVRNIQPTFNLRLEFAKIGEIEFIKNSDDGFAYLTYAKHEDALKAISNFHGKLIDCIPLEVLYAPEKYQTSYKYQQKNNAKYEPYTTHKSLENTEICKQKLIGDSDEPSKELGKSNTEKLQLDVLPIKRNWKKNNFLDINTLDEKQICMIDRCIEQYEQNIKLKAKGII